MTGIIPQQFIDDLLSHIDIVELIDGFIPLKKTGTSYSCCCPFHQEKTPSFHVIPHKQFFYCFGCGVSGNAIKFVMQHSHLAFPEAVEYLATQAGMSIPTTPTSAHHSSQISLQPFLEQINQLYQKALTQAPEALTNYLKHRGLNPEITAKFQLGYAPDDWSYLLKKFPKNLKELEESGMIIPKDHQPNHYYDRFRHRLMFPLQNRKGKYIGFAGRVIDDQHKPKYMNSPETSLFHKQKELYGLYQVLQHQEHPEFIIVVEGYLDVISLFQYGIPNAVATMGTATSAHHLQMLNKYTNKIIFCFDGDQAGLQAAWRALENCLPYYNHLSSIYFLFLPEGHDPDSYVRSQGQAGFIQAMQTAQSLPHYLSKQLYAKFGKNGPQKWIQETQKILSVLEDGPGKEVIIDALSRTSRLDPYRLKQLLLKPNTPSVIAAKSHETPSPIRLAISLLLQKPGLAQKLTPEYQDTKIYPEPLKTLIEELNASPRLSSALVIERFRDTPFFDELSSLIIASHQVPEEKQADTLIEIFEFLSRQQLNQHIDELLSKLKEQGLNADEKKCLQELLQKKHKLQIMNKKSSNTPLFD